MFNLFNPGRSMQPQKLLVLMYHRIASPYSDVWDVAVSAERFEQQLKVLQQKMPIVPLDELINTQQPSRSMAAITFDDGYVDNLQTAVPILKQYNIPATFFITSKQVHTYWWDTLEKCILFTEQLPPVFEMPANDIPLVFHLGKEAHLNSGLKKMHRAWKAGSKPPPTLRAKLFIGLWQYLKALPDAQLQQQLETIKTWAGFSNSPDPECRTISADELKELAGNHLFTIGAHTVTHAALGHHNAAYQRNEMTENRRYLEDTLSKKIDFLAYPYGSYNADTLMSAWEEGFKAAFTTEEKAIDTSLIYKLGRFQVKNFTKNEFKAALNQWLKQGL
jgi:peptidoglycan/xylan/chitin deacetylase (PgdA/CDA1 family)